MNKPVCLVVLDGWGIGDETQSNAIFSAQTPFYNHIIKDAGQIQASGRFVGLPDHQFGNSNIGHLTIGAGRIIPCPLFEIKEQLPKKISPAITPFTGTYHLISLASRGGVHAHIDHLCQLIETLLHDTSAQINLHLITDGRDRPTHASCEDLLPLSKYLDSKRVRIASLSGRYYAMDRDNNHDRTNKAIKAMTTQNHQAISLEQLIDRYLDQNTSDEFIEPETFDNSGINSGDRVIFGNFRADRMIALAKTLHQKQPDCEYFSFGHYPGLDHITCLFPPQTIDYTLGEVISQANLKQLRIAETEKYAHVTFFFNGGDNLVFPGEDRKLIPSPKVKTFDLKPEMSCHEIADHLCSAIDSNSYDFYLCNLANADMVGHTGNLDACIKAIEALDQTLMRIDEICQKTHTQLLITADHGNAEHMRYADQSPCTTHTTSPVPLILRHSPLSLHCPADSSLQDVAPTILSLMNLPIPQQMTGKVLLK